MIEVVTMEEAGAVLKSSILSIFENAAKSGTGDQGILLGYEAVRRDEARCLDAIANIAVKEIASELNIPDELDADEYALRQQKSKIVPRDLLEVDAREARAEQTILYSDPMRQIELDSELVKDVCEAIVFTLIAIEVYLLGTDDLSTVVLEELAVHAAKIAMREFRKARKSNLRNHQKCILSKAQSFANTLPEFTKYDVKEWLGDQCGQCNYKPVEGKWFVECDCRNQIGKCTLRGSHEAHIEPELEELCEKRLLVRCQDEERADCERRYRLLITEQMQIIVDQILEQTEAKRRNKNGCGTRGNSDIPEARMQKRALNDDSGE